MIVKPLMLHKGFVSREQGVMLVDPSSLIVDFVHNAPAAIPCMVVELHLAKDKLEGWGMSCQFLHY